MNELSAMPWWLWVLLSLILFAQGTFLFAHARRHGRFPWIWGLWGFISVPLPLVLYLLYWTAADWKNERKARQEAGTDVAEADGTDTDAAVDEDWINGGGNRDDNK